MNYIYGGWWIIEGNELVLKCEYGTKIRINLKTKAWKKTLDDIQLMFERDSKR